ELADQAYRTLGGMPDPGKSVWCAVARLDPRVGTEPTTEPITKSVASPDSAAQRPNSGFDSRDGGRRPFTSLPLPHQAAILCQDATFRAFLREEYNYHIETESDGVEALRSYCRVDSRRDLKPDKPEGAAFIELREQFMAWKLVAA